MAPVAERVLHSRPPGKEAILARYRINLFNVRDEAVGGCNAECANDRDACELARQVLKKGIEAEVSEGVRRVARVARGGFR